TLRSLLASSPAPAQRRADRYHARAGRRHLPFDAASALRSWRSRRRLLVVQVPSRPKVFHTLVQLAQLLGRGCLDVVQRGVVQRLRELREMVAKLAHVADMGT